MTRLRVWRHEQRMTQAQASEALGVSLAAYQLLEAGRLNPSADQINRMRRLFGDRAENMLKHVSSGISAGVA